MVHPSKLDVFFFRCHYLLIVILLPNNLIFLAQVRIEQLFIIGLNKFDDFISLLNRLKYMLVYSYNNYYYILNIIMLLNFTIL